MLTYPGVKTITRNKHTKDKVTEN